jgi:hypothetical protein
VQAGDAKHDVMRLAPERGAGGRSHPALAQAGRCPATGRRPRGSRRAPWSAGPVSLHAMTIWSWPFRWEEVASPRRGCGR